MAAHIQFRAPGHLRITPGNRSTCGFQYCYYGWYHRSADPVFPEENTPAGIGHGGVGSEDPHLCRTDCAVRGGVPTGIIGFAGKEFFMGLFSQPFVVSILLIVSGIFLYIAQRAENQGKVVDAKSALWIGVAQGCAIAPGISRSGTTIGTALLLGIKPRDAAEFSFLIGIPAMTIAAVLTWLEEPASGSGVAPLLAAIIAAFIAGYASIGLLMKWLQEKKLYYFSIYCVVAGSIFATLFYLGY